MNTLTTFNGGSECITKKEAPLVAASPCVATGKIGITIWRAEEKPGEMAVCYCHGGWILKSVPENGTWVWRHLRNDA